MISDKALLLAADTVRLFRRMQSDGIPPRGANLRLGMLWWNLERLALRLLVSGFRVLVPDGYAVWERPGRVSLRIPAPRLTASLESAAQLYLLLVPYCFPGDSTICPGLTIRRCHQNVVLDVTVSTCSAWYGGGHSLLSLWQQVQGAVLGVRELEHERTDSALP